MNKPLQFLLDKLSRSASLASHALSNSDQQRNSTENNHLDDQLKTLSIVVEQSPSTIVITDIKGNIEYVNPKFTQLTGYSAEEAIGQNTRILKSDETLPDVYKCLWKSILSGNVWRGEFCNRKKNGELYWESASISPIKNSEDVIIHFVAVKEDISKRKQMEIELKVLNESLEYRVAKRTEKLREKNTKLLNEIVKREQAEETLLLHSRILENMSEGVNLVKAGDGIIVYTNTQFNNLFGYEHGELVGRHVSVLNAPVEVTPEKKAEEIIRQLKDRGNWSGEMCNIRKDGTTFWCRANASAFNHPEFGDVWVSVHEDITDRKKKDEDLKSYGMLFDNISDLSYICDTEGNVLFLNKIFEKLSGCKVEEFIGKSFAPLFEGEDLKKAMDLYSRTLKGESPQEEVYFKGTGVLCEYKNRPLRNEEGKIIGIIGTARDITERKHIEEHIKASLKEKGVLLDEVHHRVKNNLQIISSLLDMSSMQAQNQETIKLFAESRRRVESMALIHSQLYESERFDEIDIGRHMQELSEHLLNIYSREKTITLDIKATHMYLPVTRAVPCALVLNELISNSLKHAYREGQIGTMGLFMQRSKDGKTLLKVKDDGVGISEDIDIEYAKSLGLKLVRNIVYKQLNGKIRIIRNMGTEFIIEFTDFKEEV